MVTFQTRVWGLLCGNGEQDKTMLNCIAIRKRIVFFTLTQPKLLMRKYIQIIILLSLVSSPAFSQGDKLRGSVSSAHPLATKAGLDILKKGGNAFDAAVAVASTLNVVEPMMSGMGGYGTILIYDSKHRQIRFLNSSGRFPKETNSDLMRAPALDFMKNRIGPKSISTPGNLNAWASLHQEYGKLDWKLLFQSAIHYAEDGYTITPNMARMIENAYSEFSNYSKAIYGKDGRPLKGGDRLVQSDLGKTFKQLAEVGPAPFYSGSIAKAIDRKMKEVGSFLSIDDLKSNQAEWGEPLKINYKGFDVYTAPLPANSFAAFVNVGLMRQLGSEKLIHNSGEYLHLFAEMTKQSYKARLSFSFDPEIKRAPIDSLLSNEVLKTMATALNRETASVFVPPFSPESKNTTHFVVIDGWGNIVSATQTLGNVFGSRVMVEGTGIWMNNSMAYCTFEPKGNPMDAFPGRHKLSGDCPVIILKDNQPWAALGTPGGHTITQNVPQIIFNLIDFNMSMQEAVDAPKIVFVEPSIIRVDNELPDSIFNDLKIKGHNVRRGSIGNAQGIKIIRNAKGQITGYEVGTDKRGEGRQSIIDR
jgi:gamma-glutamyltranspeptidase / glutathione hydrolase